MFQRIQLLYKSAEAENLKLQIIEGLEYAYRITTLTRTEGDIDIRFEGEIDFINCSIIDLIGNNYEAQEELMYHFHNYMERLGYKVSREYTLIINKAHEQH